MMKRTQVAVHPWACVSVPKAVSSLGFDTHVERVPWTAARRSVHFMFSKTSPCIDLLPKFNAVIEEQVQAGILTEFQTGLDPRGGSQRALSRADSVAK